MSVAVSLTLYPGSNPVALWAFSIPDPVYCPVSSRRTSSAGVFERVLCYTKIRSCTILEFRDRRSLPIDYVFFHLANLAIDAAIHTRPIDLD